jgi:hypothetical protein
VLWKTQTVSSTCLTHTLEQMEVQLRVKGVVIQREFFSDPETASQFALDKMHAYNAQ